MNKEEKDLESKLSVSRFSEKVYTQKTYGPGRIVHKSRAVPCNEKKPRQVILSLHQGF